MRYLLSTLLLAISPLSCYAEITPQQFSPAIQVLESEFEAALPHQELVKRDGNCPSGFYSCAYINVPGYCCRNNANCGIDAAGHAVCCPVGAACVGTVGGTGFVTGANTPKTTLKSTASFASAAVVAGTGTATTTASIATAGTAFAILSNPYYPFKIIPTTYLSAGGCSNAWTGCQTDMASCTRMLEGGAAAGPVTISAPNFSTATHATTTYAAFDASSICSSLSLAACSGLQVTACSYFGPGPGNSANPRPSVLCGAGVGAAVGVAGQWLLG